MKTLETNLPNREEDSTLSRIKRTNFYCVREDFLTTWREHEMFLVTYEEKVKKALMRQAKISNLNLMFVNLTYTIIKFLYLSFH